MSCQAWWQIHCELPAVVCQRSLPEKPPPRVIREDTLLSGGWVPPPVYPMLAVLVVVAALVATVEEVSWSSLWICIFMLLREIIRVHLEPLVWTVSTDFCCCLLRNRPPVPLTLFTACRCRDSWRYGCMYIQVTTFSTFLLDLDHYGIKVYAHSKISSIQVIFVFV